MSANPKLRGSKQHLLTLISDPNYVAAMNRLLSGFATVTSDECRVPAGCDAPGECGLPHFLAAHCATWFDTQHVQNWWLPQQSTGRPPKGVTWDLLSTCTVSQRRGLLLVEAKAHKSESWSRPSAQSKVNHSHIVRVLQEVNRGLRAVVGDSVNITIDSHYQLANRLAWTWKLAECGLPVVLLYLGFIGDTHFRDCFRHDDHWQGVMKVHLEGSVPLDLPGRTITVGSTGSFVLLVKSMPVEA